MDQTEVNDRVIAQFRAGGEVEGLHRERLLLLTTTGRRSGLPRTAPMMFHLDGDIPVVIASNAGAPVHPAWYRNLAADPRVVVELPDVGRAAAAAEVLTADHDRVWADLVSANPFFLEHQRMAGDRRIPLVALHLLP